MTDQEQKHLDNHTVKITAHAEHGEQTITGNSSCVNFFASIEVEGKIGPYTFPTGSKLHFSVDKLTEVCSDADGMIFDDAKVENELPNEWYDGTEYAYIVETICNLITKDPSIEAICEEQEEADDEQDEWDDDDDDGEDWGINTDGRGTYISDGVWGTNVPWG